MVSLERRTPALRVLNRFERAALIANLVEGLDLRDVGSMVACNPRQLDLLLSRATAKYKAERARTVEPSMPLASARFAPTHRAAH